MSDRSEKKARVDIVPCVWDDTSKCFVRVYSHRGVDILTEPCVTLTAADFTEPGPVVPEILNPNQNYYSDDDFRSLHHAYCRADGALKIARIALYDVSIAPGGLVTASCRDRAARVIAQIDAAMKTEGERHE